MSPSWTVTVSWFSSRKCRLSTPDFPLFVSRVPVMVTSACTVSPTRTGARNLQLSTLSRAIEQASNTPTRAASPIAKDIPSRP
jgi:hypothetical protein